MSMSLSKPNAGFNQYLLAQQVGKIERCVILQLQNMSLDSVSWFTWTATFCHFSRMPTSIDRWYDREQSFVL